MSCNVTGCSVAVAHVHLIAATNPPLPFIAIDHSGITLQELSGALVGWLAEPEMYGERLARRLLKKFAGRMFPAETS